MLWCDSLYDIKHDRYFNCNSVINKQVYPENTIDYILLYTKINIQVI